MRPDMSAASSPTPILSITRRLRRVLGLVLTVWLCSAQLAVAAHACMQGTAPSMPAQHPCAQAAEPDAAELANLCAEHCKQGKQGDQLRLPAAAAAVWRALYPVASDSAVTAEPRPMPPPDARVPIAPPHAIAHCVLRT